MSPVEGRLPSLSFPPADDSLLIVKKRENLAKAIYDVAKLVFAALALGPIVSAEVFSIRVVVVGVSITALMFVAAYIIDTGG